MSIRAALPLRDSLIKDSCFPKLPLRESWQGINPRAVCLLTIVRLLGPATLSEAVLVDVGVDVVVRGVVVDVVEVERTPFVVDVEVNAVLVVGLTDVSIIALLVKLGIAVVVDVVAISAVVVVDLVGVVVVVVVVCVWQEANSEQWH